MARRYRSVAPLTAVQVGPDGPACFGWRGRRYVVRAVLGQWVEVLPVSARRSSAGGVGVGRRAEGSLGPLGSLGTDVERVEVWRVEAVSRAGASGVYEIARTAEQWRLRRVAD